MVTDMLYLMSSFIAETEESFECQLIAGEEIKRKIMYFTNFTIAKERCFIRKQFKKRVSKKNCVTQFGNIGNERCFICLVLEYGHGNVRRVSS